MDAITYALSKKYTDNKIAESAGLHRQIVTSLPTTGDEKIIYMVRVSNDNKDSDNYNEYMWIDGNWELIGNTRVDLSDYYNKTQVDTALNGKADTSDIPTELSQLLADATHRLVTDTEKSTWNGKCDVIDLGSISATSNNDSIGKAWDAVTVYEKPVIVRWFYSGSFMALMYKYNGSQYGMATVMKYNTTDVYTLSVNNGTKTYGKASSATTLAGYGITDAYTKTEVDNKLKGKVSNSSVLKSFSASVGNITVPTGSSVITLTIPNAAKFDGLAYNILFFAKGVPNIYFQWTPDNVTTYLNVQGTWKVSANNMSGSSKTVYLQCVILWFE